MKKALLTLAFAAVARTAAAIPPSSITYQQFIVAPQSSFTVSGFSSCVPNSGEGTQTNMGGTLDWLLINQSPVNSVAWTCSSPRYIQVN